MPQEHTSDETNPSLPVAETVIDEVISSVSQHGFSEWYDERQVQQNILDGNPYFNGPSPPKPPDRHTPSKLLQCHRKAAYARQNAPREGESPDGIFWIGSTFEEDIIVPYLQDATPDGLYVQNSLWLNTTVTVDETELQLRGATDPAIVTADGTPVLLTEIKTTTSLDHLSAPKLQHKAQLHAYLYALDDKHDHPLSTGLLVYASRKNTRHSRLPGLLRPGILADRHWLDGHTNCVRTSRRVTASRPGAGLGMQLLLVQASLRAG
jgi:hypothetical protein